MRFDRAQHVVEANVGVDEIADRLHQRPAGRQFAKLRPGNVAELAVDFAVAARQQEQQHVVGQILDLVLHGVPHLDVDQSIIFDQGRRAKRDATRRHHRPAAEIAKRVVMLAEYHRRRDGQRRELANRLRSLGMDVSQEHDCGGLGKVKCRFETGANDHDESTSFGRL